MQVYKDLSLEVTARLKLQLQREIHLQLGLQDLPQNLVCLFACLL
nr:MAG TPA: hypothetical protein [Caudoviricetes sp.]